MARERIQWMSKVFNSLTVRENKGGHLRNPSASGWSTAEDQLTGTKHLSDIQGAKESRLEKVAAARLLPHTYGDVFRLFHSTGQWEIKVAP